MKKTIVKKRFRPLFWPEGFDAKAANALKQQLLKNPRKFAENLKGPDALGLLESTLKSLSPDEMKKAGRIIGDKYGQDSFIDLLEGEGRNYKGERKYFTESLARGIGRNALHFAQGMNLKGAYYFGSWLAWHGADRFASALGNNVLWFARGLGENAHAFMEGFGGKWHSFVRVLDPKIRAAVIKELGGIEKMTPQVRFQTEIVEKIPIYSSKKGGEIAGFIQGGNKRHYEGHFTLRLYGLKNGKETLLYTQGMRHVDKDMLRIRSTQGEAGVLKHIERFRLDSGKELDYALLDETLKLAKKCGIKAVTFNDPMAEEMHSDIRRNANYKKKINRIYALFELFDFKRMELLSEQHMLYYKKL